MLLVDLRPLRDGPIQTTASVPADDPVIADTNVQLGAPVTVRGRLSESGPGRYYWHGKVSAVAVGQCRRCLTDVQTPMTLDVRAVFAEAVPGEETAMYAIPVGARELDLGPAVREELILSAPDYVVCRDACLGLCDQCGKNLNEGPCDCRPVPNPQWAALEALKARWADDEES